MDRLTTYIHDTPVRQSGVTYEATIQKLAQYEDSGLTPDAVRWLLSDNEKLEKQHKSEIQGLEDEIISLRLYLQEYEEEGPVRLFRLLKNRFKNEVCV